MRSSASEIVTALGDARHKGLVPLRYVTIWPRNRETGLPVQFGFWSDPVPAAVPIANRVTGDLETRNFDGGALLGIGKVKLTTGLKIQPWSFTLNALHPAVRDMLENHDVRLAWVEYHRVPGSTISRRPVTVPARRFLGKVDGAPRPIPGINSESAVTISCIDATEELTRTNPIRRSGVAQSRRSGDEQMQYVDVVGDWDVDWGQASGSVE